MTIYYMDTAGSNTAPYDTWLKAATSLQTVADLAVAGDTVYCRGSQTLAAPIDIDTNSGTIVDGWIKFIGCNGAGNVDGTRFELDGNGATADCILGAGELIYIWWENFEIHSSTADGVDATSSNDYWVFINCIAHSNVTGFNSGSISSWYYIRCQAYNNSGYGWAGVNTFCKFLFCVGYINTSGSIDGTTSTDRCVFLGCIFHDDGNNIDLVTDLDAGNFVMNCVFDGTDQTGETGLNVVSINNVIIGNRFTNSAIGLEFEAAANMNIYGWNLFHNNTADLSDGGVGNETIPLDGDSDTNEYDPDADDGFNDVANHDFNLKASRTLRSTAIDLNIGS